MLLKPNRSDRRGVAAVEFSFVAPVVFMLLVGVWEVGRLIQIQQILDNSAREGARIAAQGITINSVGASTEIKVNTGSPSVKTTVFNYLKRAGLNVTSSDVTVNFAFTTGNTSFTEPYQAVKGQQFKVTVTIPTSKVQWITFGMIKPATMTATVYWTSLVDDPFTIDVNLPTW